MRILLTGGTGFFGKSLLDSGLLPEAAELTVLSRRGTCPGFEHRKNTEFLAGDVRTVSLAGRSFDVLIHAAAPSGSKVSDEEMYSIVADGTRNMLVQAQRTHVQKILFVSSGAVYGPLGTAPVAEDAPLRPVTPYGTGKLEAEKMCLKSGIPVVIARCFAFMGKYLPRDVHFAAGNFLEDLLQKRKIVIRGDGRPFRSYMYAQTLALWLMGLLQKGVPGEAYNVGSPEGVSIRTLAETVAAFAEPALPVEVLSKPENTPVPGYVPDISKALELGLPEPEPLKEVVRLTLESL